MLLLVVHILDCSNQDFMKDLGLLWTNLSPKDKAVYSPASNEIFLEI